MSSIINELEKRCKEHPDRLLYAFLNINGDIKESYTYAEFNARTESIASHIYNAHKFEKGDRVLLVYPPGLEMICAFFACARIGLIPVPVYPPSDQGFDVAVKKMNFISEDCGAAGVLTSRSYFWSIKANLNRKGLDKKKVTVLNLIWIATDDFGSAPLKSFEASSLKILFIQYTSGSTNSPKGVMVSHENMLDNCENVVDHTPIGVTWLPQYHDMGLIGYYIFFALKGGTTYGFSPRDFILRPSLWLETISKYKGTASSAPNFAFEYCLAPGRISEETLNTLNLASLRFLMNAAEPINPSVHKAFIQKFSAYGLDSDCVFGAYGLAENTLAVSNYGLKIKTIDVSYLSKNSVVERKASDDTMTIEMMSCGRILGDTVVKIVDIENDFVTLEDDKVGEIWVNGSSKCLGYWNQPSLTRQKFEATIHDQPNSAKYLRTGDLGFIHNGELFICGRLKDTIIIRGLNYYPQDIQSIVEEDPEVRKGCVVAFSVEEDKLEKLTIIVGVKNAKKLPNADSINTRIINYLGIGANRIVFVPARTISKTSSGKIMNHLNKKRLIEKDFQLLEEVYFDRDDLETESWNNDKHNLEGTSGFPKRLDSVESLFHKYKMQGNETSALGDSGLDSMKLAEFSHDLRKFVERRGFDDLANEIDLRILQKIAVSELYEILKDLHQQNQQSRYHFKKAFARIKREYLKVELGLMKRDATSILDENLLKNNRPVDPSNGSIFLTGGTGFFGPFLIKSILEQNKEFIYVLVRAENDTEGKARLVKAFDCIHPKKELMESFHRRVIPVCGNLNKFKLGLSIKTWEFLSNEIHTIYHNGALVNYLLDYESMKGVNVDGTNEIIRLATSNRTKVLNHISTTFIYGWSVKDILFETDANEKMELLDFGYSQSKWVAEKIVAEAMSKGLPARIFRPALISPAVNGGGHNFDISMRLLVFMLKYGITTTAKNQVSFTPADLCANNIVAISNIEESINKAFQVTRDEYSTLQDVTEILGKLIGKRFDYYNLEDFVPEVISRCQKDDLLFPLLNFLVRSIDNISKMEFKRYDNTNYAKYREQSPWGKKDVSLETVVKGIHLFMVRNDINLN